MSRRVLLALPAALFGQYEEGPGDVPWVPTPEEIVEQMLRMGRVGPSDVVYDLGCGDGRIVITAAKKFGCRGVGIDIDPKRIGEANAAAQAAGVTDKVTFLEQDVFKADFREATVVMLYLFTTMNDKLQPMLMEQLKPGTRVVAHQFGFTKWKPKKRWKKGYRKVMYFEIPARKAISFPQLLSESAG